MQSTRGCIKDAMCRLSYKPMVFFVFWILLSTILPNYVPISMINKQAHGLTDIDGYFTNGKPRYELNYDDVVNIGGLINSEIVLVIAHPDDESMFFGPSLIELSKKNYNNNIHVICFSNGNYENMGDIREQELYESARILGFSSVKVLKYEDDIHKSWDYGLVKQSLIDTLEESPIGEDSTKTGLVLMTFDESGVSGHPNHISLYNGVKELITDEKSLKERAIFQKFDRIDYWNLKSWNLILKYSGQVVTNFEIFWKLVSNYYESDLKSSRLVELVAGKSKEYHSLLSNQLSQQGITSSMAPYLPGYHRTEKKTTIKLQSDLSMWFVNMSCMSYAHYSQIVWFRWIWLLFSKYLNSNELVLVCSVKV